MSTAIAEAVRVPATLDTLTDKAREFVGKSVSTATKKAHRIDWQQFCRWCGEHDLPALPATPRTVVLWLSDVQRMYKMASMERKLASISKAHQAAGYDSPTRNAIVHQTLKGIRRAKIEAGYDVQPIKKAPLTAPDLRAIVAALPDTLKGKRDRALLLLGYAGGFRRSELSALDLEDLTFEKRGVLVRLRVSKTNQSGERDEVKDICYGANVATCPVAALEAWLQASDIEAGAVFRQVTRHNTLRAGRLSGDSICAICKRLAGVVGKDPDDIGAHSLRAGFVTDAFNAGVPTPAIMGMTGHACERVLHGYYRTAKRFERNLSAAVGL